MKDRETEATPAAVPEGVIRTGEVRARWAWTEPTIWTDRMLTALEQGVKGGSWYSLIDKVQAETTLRIAYAQVEANDGAAGVDRQTVEMFGRDLDANLRTLAEELKGGTYRPRAVRRVWVPKAGNPTEKRPLGVPTVRDRVAQAAVTKVIEPIFEKEFAAHSYGFRPRRGCKDALGRVWEMLNDGYTWVVDADLKSYFDTIPHERLLERVSEKVSDGKLLSVIRSFLQQGVMDEGKHWTPEEGTPQGGVLSPLLSNIYLNPLDHHMAKRGYQMVRYADDFVVLCRSEAEAHQALGEIRQWVETAGLTLHPEKTRVVDSTQRGGFEFLGYHFERGHRWARKKSVEKLRGTIRRKTKRTNGHSLQVIIETVNETLRGWYGYFSESIPNIFAREDSWVRMRLRSILRRRIHLRGRGRGVDHQRWPNQFFAEHGLFSLLHAHARNSQSSTR